MNAYLFKPRRRVRGKLRVSKFWHVRYQAEGDERYKSKNLGVRDQQVATKRLNEFLLECEFEAAGVTVPKVLREAAGKSMADHLADFVADLKARKRAPMYVDNINNRVVKLLAACSWALPKDVTVDSFTTWRNGQTTAAAKTLNDYLDAANALLGWMQRRGRSIANPLRSVGKVKTAGKETRVRRAFTVDELERLLALKTGRRCLYLAALLTGLRRAELRALEWADVHLDAVKPFLSARASTTKNSKLATIWVRDDLAAELRAHRPVDAAPADRVFPRLGRKMGWFKADLAAAGIAFKVNGRQADFHSLRHSLGTLLNASAKVSSRTVMEVMRHSDMRLTMRTYTDALLLPSAEALEELPRFDGPAREAVAATGTDGPANDTQNDTQNLVQQGQTASLRVTASAGGDDGKTSGNASESADLSAGVHASQGAGVNRGTRIRT